MKPAWAQVRVIEAGKITSRNIQLVGLRVGYRMILFRGDFYPSQDRRFNTMSEGDFGASLRNMKIDVANLRNGAKLIATDGTKGSFLLFIRQNRDFQENFSVGLSYHSQDGRHELRLLRCNGKHGEFNRGNNAFDPAHPHWNFHVHTATQDAIDSGYTAEMNATVTTEFASLIEAVQYLLKVGQP